MINKVLLRDVFKILTAFRFDMANALKALVIGFLLWASYSFSRCFAHVFFKERFCPEALALRRYYSRIVNREIPYSPLKYAVENKQNN